MVFIENTDHFAQLRPQASVVYFFADWYQPCEQTTRVLLALENEHKEVVCLHVNAEAYPEVSSLFPVKSVPSFFFLENGVTVEALEGADVPALVSAFKRRVGVLSAPSQSSPVLDDTAFQAHLLSLTRLAPLTVFIKGSPDAPRCGFSRQLVKLLRDEKLQFAHFDILIDERVRAGLKVLSSWPTFPQVFFQGEFLGGLDIIKEMKESGDLQSQFK